MAHTRQYDTSDPLDTGLAGAGGSEIRNFKVDIKDRMQLDHYWQTSPDSVTDTALPDADGYHKKVTLKSLAAEPTLLTGSGILFVQDNGTTPELYYKNSVGTYKVINREAYLYSASLAGPGYFSWNAAIHDDLSLTIATTSITIPTGQYLLELQPPSGYGATVTYSIEIAGNKTAFSGMFYKLVVTEATIFKIYADISGATIGSMRIRQL